MKILVTGMAGFIGFHLAEKLAERGDTVVGLDNINDYYDVNLKYGRLKEAGFLKEEIKHKQLLQSTKYPNLYFTQLNLEDKENLNKLFSEQKFDTVINLAAQAGVRYSLKNPKAYIDSNIYGFLNILEACREFNIKHLTYASSSSVYGLNEKQPFSIKDKTDQPASLYAASKKSNELMAHTYSHLFNIPTTGLRFFTVYGPWGRPDMAFFLFTKAILENKPIDVFNFGKMQRDFTYISDIIEGIIRVNDNPPKENKIEVEPPYKIYNIGNSKPVELLKFIEAIEEKLKRKAEKNFLPMQSGDVISTYADISELEKDLSYKPETTIKEGISNFIDWYKEFYK